MLENIHAVLFDLDGTLVDTAPDLGHALNLQRARHGLPPLADDVIRPQASHGARGLLGVGFDLHPDNPRFGHMREEFLQLYAENICRYSRPFPGIPELLQALEQRGLKWGVVTNKFERFAVPLIEALGLGARASVVVGGDTCPRPKPFPDPLLFAAAEIGIAPMRTLYVGDDERDVQAARAAGMPVLVAAYGYLGDGTPPVFWGADALVDAPGGIAEWVGERRAPP